MRRLGSEPFYLGWYIYLLRNPVVNIDSDPEGLTTAIQLDNLSLTLVRRVKIKFVY